MTLNQETNRKSIRNRAPSHSNPPRAKVLSNASGGRRPMAAIALGYKLESDNPKVLEKVKDRLISERNRDPTRSRGEKCIEDFF